MKRTITFLSIILLSCFFLSSTTLLDITGILDLNDLENYADQDIPDYITLDNTTPNNAITDAGATLGRVLFYDKNLSLNNTIACASCHKQEFAFSDLAQLSTGQSGDLTGRHSIRLINARFSDEAKFFWDERANTLEQQTTMPIQDHIEMGFSGTNGDPDFDSLITKMEGLDYYQDLFDFVFGDPQITEFRMQRAMAQFIRSIQSFDSKYDVGRSQVPNNNAPFPNFTPEENLGKNLFMTIPTSGGAGCNGCHRAPEFSIDPNSLNNGVIGVAGVPGEIDLTNTRSPSLRDMINPSGLPNGPFMHNGVFGNLLGVINHYNDIANLPANVNLDPRLSGGNNLDLTQAEKDALIAFLGTLTGQAVYTDEKWSDPFDEAGNLMVIMPCGAGIFTSVNANICEGENFEGYTETGIYNDVFTAANGCDSTRILNLSVLQKSIEFLSTEICEGEMFEGYSEAGIYEDTFLGANGCDSIRTLLLAVLPQAENTVIAEICEGENFEGYAQTGTYTDLLTAANGCDSSRVLQLTVLPQAQTNISAEICEGENFDGYTQSGIYESVFVAANGCDSIRTLDLSVLPASDPDCLPNSAGENHLEKSLQVFPNPFNDDFQLSLDQGGKFHYSILSSTGIKLQFGEVDFSAGPAIISSNGLPQGIYFLRLQKENGTAQIVKRLVKNGD